MRIAIDYTAAVNQTAGIGRFVRDLVQALSEVDKENDYVLLHAAPNRGHEVNAPQQENFDVRGMRLPERFLNVCWHRLNLPIPVDIATGAVDVFHSPDFVLPPVRSGKRIITVHD